jgi:hypothetical protein
VVAGGWNILFYLVCVNRNSFNTFFLFFDRSFLHHRSLTNIFVLKTEAPTESQLKKSCRQKSSFDVWMIWERSIYFKINLLALMIRI